MGGGGVLLARVAVVPALIPVCAMVAMLSSCAVLYGGEAAVDDVTRVAARVASFQRVASALVLLVLLAPPVSIRGGPNDSVPWSLVAEGPIVRRPVLL